MTKQAVKAEFNNFVKGLVTEASPLNFPQNASLDEENFELNREGSRQRRLGMGLEEEFLFLNGKVVDNDPSLVKPTTFEWHSVGGDESFSVLVVQFENTLHFFDLKKEPLAGNGFIDTLLTTFPYDATFSYASVDGRLVITAGADTVGIVSYKTGTGFSIEYDRLIVRDVWGVQETGIPEYENDVSYRGALSSGEHYYNLQNQSWGIPRRNSTNNLLDPVFIYFGALLVYPSNSETVWPGLQYQPVSPGNDPYERVYPNIYTEVLGADVKSPKGYYKIDLLRRGTSRATEFINNKAKYPELTVASVFLPEDYTSGGPTICTDFAGRVWYGGFNGEVINGDARSPNLNNYIFFSQLIKNRQDFVKCYQEGDPTSRENSDVVDTDGGGLRISGMDRLVGLVNLSSNLIVIGTNGVWSVTGGSDFGFTPTNIKVDKLSNFGGMSRSSIVVHQGRAFFWGEDGIYVVAKNEFGDFGVANITEKTIQTYYQNISNEAKNSCVGVYDFLNKKIRWMFKTGTLFSTASRTYELVFDVVLNAFYKHRIYNSPNFKYEAMSPIAPIGYRSFEQVDLVVVNEDQVSVDGQYVQVTHTVDNEGSRVVRYLVCENSPTVRFGFGSYNNSEFRDWEEDVNGTDAFAYMEAGETIGGDSSIPKQLPYVTMHFYRTEEGVDEDTLEPLNQSSCLMRFKWDFANGVSSNKWSRLSEVYRYRKPRIVTGPDDDYDTGFQLITTKNKIRGRGKSFRMYVETQPYKDCQIVGWNLTGNTNAIT